MDTRQLARARIAQSQSSSLPSCTTVAFFCCVALPLTVLYAAQSGQPASASQQPYAIVESVKPLEPLGGRPHTSLMRSAHERPRRVRSGREEEVERRTPPPRVAASVMASSLLPQAKRGVAIAEHESSQPMAVLNRERAKAGGAQFGGAFRVYRPPDGFVRPGGDLDDAATLPNAVAASSDQGEVMLLCIGGSGSMRAGMNLVMNFRTMGLYHMLILAPAKAVCDDLWAALPSLACVWWPSIFTNPRPNSLYNTMFSRTALAFFEGRKILMERLVLKHKLNVLHLDADTVWFANPYPLFKTLYKEYSLIIQTDNPFANAGIMYVQNIQDGDAAAWVLQELNRRIARFTYHPESVTALPNSAWSTPPHFANADEQANLNDILTTCLNGEPTYSAGVEFYEARFKRDKGDKHAKKLMSNGAWGSRMSQGAVGPARRNLKNLAPIKRYEPLVHLCKPSLWVGVQQAELSIPKNTTAPTSKLLLAPEWLFSHFPYGAFFPSFRDCHADSWGFAKLSALEQRLCMPTFRVPVVMVHMAGLRNGQWGRRGVMRALGVWHEAADSVAVSDWVSPRTDKLLIVDGPFVSQFGSMRDFDRFACRLLLLAALLGRRAVIPSMPCESRWAQSAMEPRHLRGLEVGCGKHKQCVWLPMPHFKEAWCSGVDFVYSIDYEGMVDKGEIDPRRDVASLAADEIRLTPEASSSGGGSGGGGGGSGGGGGGGGGSLIHYVGGKSQTATFHEARVLKLQGSRSGDPLAWLPLDGFVNRGGWQRDGLPRRVEAALRAYAPSMGFNTSQVDIFKDCMQSLATSRD